MLCPLFPPSYHVRLRPFPEKPLHPPSLYTHTLPKTPSSLPRSPPFQDFNPFEASFSFPRASHTPDFSYFIDTHRDFALTYKSVADLHYSVGTGSCRDSDKEPCVGDPDTATWLADALDAEQPDLVVSSDPLLCWNVLTIHQVFSGDQLNGQETSFDSRSVIAKFAKPVIEREIPWCAIFGG